MNIILLILSIFLGPVGQADDCKCQKVSDQVATHWGQDSITVQGVRPTRVLQGRVLYPTGAPLREALVEVFEAPGGELTSGKAAARGKEKPRRIAACLTGEDGEFCFSGLPAGKYELRGSKSGFDTYRMLADVNPQNAPDGFDVELDESK